MRRILHQSSFPVDSIEGLSPLKRRVRIRKLAAIYRANLRVVKVRNQGFQPVLRSGNGILREKDESSSLRQSGREIPRTCVMKIFGRNLRDVNR